MLYKAKKLAIHEITCQGLKIPGWNLQVLLYCHIHSSKNAANRLNYWRNIDCFADLVYKYWQKATSLSLGSIQKVLFFWLEFMFKSEKIMLPAFFYFRLCKWDTLENQTIELFVRLSHYLRHHKYCELFNKNNIKISYSCMPNMASVIRNHSTSLLKDAAPTDINECSCRQKTEGP